MLRLPQVPVRLSQHQRVLQSQRQPVPLNPHQQVHRLQQAPVLRPQLQPQQVLQSQQAQAPQPQHQQVRQLQHQPVLRLQQAHQFQIQQTIRTHKLEILLDRQVNPKKNCLIQVLSRQLDLCYLEF